MKHEEVQEASAQGCGCDQGTVYEPHLNMVKVWGGSPTPLLVKEQNVSESATSAYRLYD